VLDLTIGVANTVAQSWSGPISCDSLFPVAQALHPTESRSAIRCQRSPRFTGTDLHMPVFPICLPSAFRNSTRWSRQLEIYRRVKRIFVGEEMGHDWSPRINKAERIDRGERGLLVALTVIAW